jgi:ferritin-like metal-binding protein YciE
VAKIEQPRELLLEQLKSLLYVEEQLSEKVIPELVEQSENSDLKQGLSLHSTQTHEHVVNVRKAFELLGEEPETKDDPALDGLRKQHEQVVKQLESPKLKDLANVDAVVKTEQLEIGAYTTLLELVRAMKLGGDLEELLQSNLDDEKQALELAEQALSQLSERAAAISATPGGG